MRKNSLSTTGLSMSQAQSISNTCFQRASEITNIISGINNATKSLNLNGENYIETVGKPIPENIVELLKEKAMLHACQAFLMENIKAKEDLLVQKRKESFEYSGTYPIYPDLKVAEILPMVCENWGFDQLSLAETNEYLEVEAIAAHIGQFIHKNSPLDTLRKELSTMKTLEWILIKEGEKSPLKVDIHHKSAYLLLLHEELSTLHRDAEQRVNYFKAKSKNLVSDENARIAALNGKNQAEINAYNNPLLNQYQIDSVKYTNLVKELVQQFESNKEKAIKEIAQLRIDVDVRFQPVIDMFIQQQIP